MKKILSFVLLTAMLLTTLVVSTSAAARDGTTASASLKGEGTAASPYLIESAADLAFLAKDVNENGNKYSGKYITQTADIDLGGKEWTPIGKDTSKVFSGVYNGCGYTIKGFYQSTPLKFSGLFGYITTSDAEAGIANLTLEGEMKVDGSTLKDHWSVSPLVGWSHQNSGTSLAKRIKIINVTTDVDITVTNYTSEGRVAGVSAYAYCTDFENVVNNGNITVTGANAGRAGGFVAETNRTTFTNCVNNGNVTVTADTGSVRVSGFIAYISKASADMAVSLKNCVNNGKLSSKSGADKQTTWTAGMFADCATGAYALNLVIENCLNTGAISGVTGGTSGGYAHTGGIGGYPQNGNSAITLKGCVNTSTEITYQGGTQDRTCDMIGTVYSPNVSDIILENCIAIGDLKSVTFSVTNKETAAVNCQEKVEAAVATAAAKKITDALTTSATKINGFDTAYKAPAAPETPVTPPVATGDATVAVVVLATVALFGIAFVSKKVSVR